MPAERVRTSPESLRQEIRSAELAVAALRPDANRESALGLLRRLDRIDDAVEHLAGRGVDLRAERARIETVHSIALAKSAVLAHALAGEWDALRAEAEATRPRWWWYLDQRAAAGRSRRRWRTGWVLAGALLAVGVLVGAYLLFLQPDEATRRRLGLLSQAEGLVEGGAYAEAAALYREAAELAPQDADLPLTLGVLYEALDEPEAAAEAYARARALYGDEALYWAYRSGRYLLLGWWEQGALAAQKAIELDPDLALAYCYLGSTYEAQGEIRQATAAVRRCSDLAREQDQDELYVLAMSRLAGLLQASR